MVPFNDIAFSADSLLEKVMYADLEKNQSTLKILTQVTTKNNIENKKT